MQTGRLPVEDHEKPRWFTPRRLLVIFCITNLLVYLDRGVPSRVAGIIASNGVNGSPRTTESPMGSGIQGEFNLSNAEDGLLATAFLIGLMLASPVFSEACKHTSAFRLIGLGMAAWAVAAITCGLAPSYGMLLTARALVGVGEASFVALASPFIDDYAPPSRKARWFAIFYLCIPVGFAAGYMFGGVVAGALGWRAAFIIEAFAAVPFIIFTLTSRPLHLVGSHDSGPDPDAPRTLASAAAELSRDAVAVARHAVWRNMVAAYVLYTAVLGVYAFWGPKAGARIFSLPAQTADLAFGALTVVTGVAGSLGGGVALDALGATLSNAALLCGVGNLVGLALALVAFMCAHSFPVFVVLFGLAELALFSQQAPVTALVLWGVPPHLRPLSISMTTVLIHLFGDVPSPPLAGMLQSALEADALPALRDQRWRATMSLVSALLVASGCVFLRCGHVATRSPDYRRPDEAAAAAAAAEAHHLPAALLPHSPRRGGGGGGGGGSGGESAALYGEGRHLGAGEHAGAGSRSAGTTAGCFSGGGSSSGNDVPAGDREPLLDRSAAGGGSTAV